MPINPTEIHLKHSIPDAVEPFAELALSMVSLFLLSGRVRDLALLTFRDAEARLWELGDTPSTDDLLREIAEREAAAAIVVVRPVPPPPNTQRAFTIAVECAAGKFDWLVGLQSGPPRDQLRILHPDEPKYRNRIMTRGSSRL